MSLETAETAPTEPTLYSWFALGVILLGTVLALYCVFTIYRNKHFDEVHKLGWLLIALALPIFGPIAWMIRSHREKQYRAHPDYREPSAKPQDSEDDAAAASRARVYRPRSVVSSSDLSDLDTSDSPENPFITQNENGTRGLKF